MITCFGATGIDAAPAPAAVSGLVSGVVVAKTTGRPIPRALVRVSSPALEMRGATRYRRIGEFEQTTDAAGRFRIVVPPSKRISLNVRAPGYEELAGRWMSSKGDFQAIPFGSGQATGLRIQLEPALYVAGIAVDEAGNPLADVRVEATIHDQTGYGYVAFDQTDGRGRFEIFDFSLQPFGLSGGTNGRGQLTFEDPKLLKSTIADVYALKPAEVGNLRVILRGGRQIRGTLISSTGNPVSGNTVEAIPADGQATRRLAGTDTRGRFVLVGLPPGEITLIAQSLALKQKARAVIQPGETNLEANLQLKPIVYKNPPKEIEVLGMRLADMTPELLDIYEWYPPTGVVILDPGASHLRLGIGELSEGESFWIVGEREITNVREFVDELLRINALEPPGPPNEGCHGSVRVVYQYPRRGGTMTQRLTLTGQDVKELRSVAAMLASSWLTR